jgi:biopolymer transport protein ExbD
MQIRITAWAVLSIVSACVFAGCQPSNTAVEVQPGTAPPPAVTQPTAASPVIVTMLDDGGYLVDGAEVGSKDNLAKAIVNAHVRTRTAMIAPHAGAKWADVAPVIQAAVDANIEHIEFAGMSYDLPDGRGLRCPSMDTPPPDPVVIRCNGDGTFAVNGGGPLKSAEQAEKALAAVARQKKDSLTRIPAVIFPDNDVPWTMVRDVYRIVRQCGFEKIGFTVPMQ